VIDPKPANPERYEGDRSATSRDGFLTALRPIADGVGFVTALARGDGTFEFACLAEALIADPGNLGRHWRAGT
jgi:hypothetical protein